MDTAIDNATPAELFGLLTTSNGSNPTIKEKYENPGQSHWNLSDNDIIPQEYQDELIFWRDVFKKGQFRIGDIAKDCIMASSERGLSVNQGRIFDAVGRFCGCGGRTVRYYYETAIFYPQVVRDHYDMLPFSHFVFARSVGVKWRDVLDVGKSDPSMTEGKLRYIFLENAESSQGFTEIPVCENRFNSVVERELLAGHNDQYRARLLLDKVGELADVIERLTCMVDLSEQAMSRLCVALSEIRSVAPELAQLIHNADRVDIDEG